MANDMGYHCRHDGQRKKECIQCGKCLEVCPLFQATQREELSPRAKFFMAGESWKRGSGVQLDEGKCAELASICLACGRCERACAQELCGPELVADLREAHPEFRQWLWKHWVAQAGLLWPLASGLSKALPRTGLASLGGLAGKARALTEYSISPWLEVEEFDPVGKGRAAVIFAGCTANHGRKRWLSTAQSLVRGLGFDLSGDPGFSCCACTLGHAGEKKLQKELQKANIETWRKAGRPMMITFCATCRCGLRSYPSVDLGWETFEREAWLEAVVPLASHFGETKFRVLENAPDAVYYHRPCHGSGANPDLDFLQRATGGRIAKASTEQCCGFGGVMQLGAPALSAKVAGECWKFFDPEPGGQLITGCSGCALQLASTAPKGVFAGHWLEIFGDGAWIAVRPHLLELTHD